MALKKVLLGRLLGRAEPRPAELAVVVPEESSAGLYLQLDDDGRVVQLSDPLRGLLAPAHADRRLLMDYLTPDSALVVEGIPKDWFGLTLDLDFKGAGGHVVHTRGWVQTHESRNREHGWRLQLLDVGDLLRETLAAQCRQQCLLSAGRMAEKIRACSFARLVDVVGEQLQDLAQRWRVPCLALVLPEPNGRGWQVYSHFNAHTAPTLWQAGQRLGHELNSLDGAVAHQLAFGAHGELPHLQSAFGNADGFLLPYREEAGAMAWLLFGFYQADEQAPDLSQREWLQLCVAVAGSVLVRLAEDQHQQQLERLNVLQELLGTGWWEWLPNGEMQLAPQLAQGLRLATGCDRLSHKDWLDMIHPSDRQELASRLIELRDRGTPLVACVRMRAPDLAHRVVWQRIQGQLVVSGQVRRVLGFMLDVSDIKNQETQAAAAHARLDNLVASSPAVIYVQRYVEGALLPTFFSHSLKPLLGLTLADCSDGQLGNYIHPEDRDLYFAHTRELLREGTVRSRYRLRDALGNYHWLLDEAKLLRDDLGIPIEAVGLWLDVTEATLAAEQVRQSEERYRILVEDSPAMICRYSPALILSFGNRPLAKYLECSSDALVGINLGDWLSPDQREAFMQRINQLSPASPVSTAEICLELPGREHAWWMWTDRGVFDGAGALLEVQAVGRDNTEIRRTQMQLTQSAKMATLGEMATGLAHEINQPLHVMSMAVVNALKRLSSGEVEVEYLTEKLNRIDAQVKRAARVVDHMRVFGRRSEIHQQLFGPAQAIEGTVAMLTEGLKGKGVELRVSVLNGPLLSGPVQVRGHADQLEQVLINLVINARDALLSKLDIDRDFQPWIGLQVEHDEQMVWLSVEDNGGGVDPRLLERVFEPFFTTKPVGVGTGLGLSVSYGIVELMGGRLSVTNTAEGARFRIALPLAIGELDH
ncbi:MULTISPECIES: ATP-binding protein [unclassified Pseudomonas]|uniref:ATP-binding protein n=1 Tax=unclassified Pseudomonas TaxID=196821 RepID=UPI002AC905B0|nr:MULTISPECIES: ATP-binding protein [unclassified Pseudomonas]MEB0041625.1 PAS domain-containing protein [Pseudomonas sp. MH10]MEB0121999.1 PAS domain-containing protein [Pseudomonas sp. CCI1.2]WPX61938.1 PAS domain-containing protein [Pseudomonas sp. MH10]